MCKQIKKQEQGRQKLQDCKGDLGLSGCYRMFVCHQPYDAINLRIPQAEQSLRQPAPEVCVCFQMIDNIFVLPDLPFARGWFLAYDTGIVARSPMSSCPQSKQLFHSQVRVSLAGQQVIPSLLFRVEEVSRDIRQVEVPGFISPV